MSCAPLSLVTGDFSPYSGPGLPDGGQSTRLVTTLLREAGYDELKVDYLPWNRGYELVRNGLASATFPYAWTRERAKLFYYSAPIHIDHLSWFTYRGSDAVLDGKWQGLRVCIPASWSTSHADEVIARFSLRLTRPKSLVQCLQLLERKRVDLMPMNDAVTADASMQVFGDPNYLQPLPYFRQRDTFYLLVSRKMQNGRELIERFNEALAAARASGHYDQLVPWGQPRLLRCEQP
ncbi:substrate-binding periplasmic protein [Aeromonas veronii]|uniref:substrate-binding periplasmic protein n=1 Tax=Aeromonas TaxID=642 RepID=UPI001D0B787D|nr:transporter substrate-binding domain-containing protein [Aeromonas veronii]UDN23454.1 transporter substrate-binding domain-containing protein [Aeromonas veronii]